MNQDELTTKEAAEAIGVPVSTLKNWVGRLPVPSQLDSQGNRRFSADAVEVLKRIKDLRLEENRGYDTIRRVLEPVISQDTSKPEPGQAQDQPKENQGPSLDTEAIVARVVEAIGAQTDLAQKYATAAHQIGRLEAENEYLRKQLTEAQEKIVLLEAPKEEPKVEPKRPWWKPW